MARKPKPRTRRRRRWRRYLPSAPIRRRWARAFRRAPGYVQFALVLVALVVAWFASNGVYQVVKKPTELFFPVSGTLNKSPAETWDQYESLFRSNSTAALSPEFLAALAQIEASGNPIARTYWRWSLTSHPFEVYRPASSAVGMYQLTDGTFDQARDLCIHDHHVVEDGPWNAWRSCWFNWLYSRVVPSDAVEMTAAYLDYHVARILEHRRVAAATIAQKQNTAALMHLCGVGAADDYVAHGFKLRPGQQCGDHSAASYVAKMNAMKAVFARFAAGQGG
jgi:hypothetical protein